MASLILSCTGHVPGSAKLEWHYLSQYRPRLIEWCVPQKALGLIVTYICTN